MKLYGHQQDLINRVRGQFTYGATAVLIQLPTGGGKTVVAAHIIKGAISKDKRILMVAHRKELVYQAFRTLEAMGVRAGMVMTGEAMDFGAEVFVGMIQTVINKIKAGHLDKFDLLFIDEAHHAAATSYRKLMLLNEKAQVIGLTATPERTDGQGLADIFEVMVSGENTDWLIKKGYLSPFSAYTKEHIDTKDLRKKGKDFAADSIEAQILKQNMMAEPYKQWMRYAEGKKAIVFSPNVRTSQIVCEIFNKNGVRSEHLDGSHAQGFRDSQIEQFRSGNMRVLCNVDLFGEGFDVPNAECAILFRPTKSLTIHLQQCGRVLRKDPENPNKKAIIIDIAGNCMTHCLPDFDIAWTLEGSGSPEYRFDRSHTMTWQVACEICSKIFSVTKKIRTEVVCVSCAADMASASDGEAKMRLIEKKYVQPSLYDGFADRVRDIYITNTPNVARNMALRLALVEDVSTPAARYICDLVEGDLS